MALSFQSRGEKVLVKYILDASVVTPDVYRLFFQHSQNSVLIFRVYIIWELELDSNSSTIKMKYKIQDDSAGHIYLRA